jgi:uncharacterized protein (DUF2237 family)
VNVLGGDLEPCSFDPVTGYFRDGYCRTEGVDLGFHAVCAVMTEEFLTFSVSRGNDLVTPQPQWMFPGLRAGDRWCVVAARWQEALAPLRRSCSRRRMPRRSSSSRSRI